MAEIRMVWIIILLKKKKNPLKMVNCLIQNDEWQALSQTAMQSSGSFHLQITPPWSLCSPVTRPGIHTILQWTCCKVLASASVHAPGLSNGIAQLQG